MNKDYMFINNEIELMEAKNIGYTMLLSVFSDNRAKYFACDDYKNVTIELTGQEYDESGTLHIAFPINETFGREKLDFNN